MAGYASVMQAAAVAGVGIHTMKTWAAEGKVDSTIVKGRRLVLLESIQSARTG